MERLWGVECESWVGRFGPRNPHPITYRDTAANRAELCAPHVRMDILPICSKDATDFIIAHSVSSDANNASMAMRSIQRFSNESTP